MTSLPMKIRAFDRILDADTDHPFRASAAIDDDGVLVSISGSEHRVRAIERGTDEGGEFAVIEPGEWHLNFGFVLIVEVEPEQDEPYGCRISLRRPQPEEVRQEQNELLRGEGIKPQSVNLLIPPAFSISIYVNHWGVVTGHASLRPGPPPEQSTTH